MTSPKPASTRTAEANRTFLDRLPFDDTSDFDDARRGLIADTPHRKITNPDESVSFDLDAYGFVRGAEAPDTVNPSLWRQSQLVGITGLFEVVEGIYQVRNYDLAVMTFIRGTSGWIVVDPLVTAAPAAEALRMVREHVARPRPPMVGRPRTGRLPVEGRRRDSRQGVDRIPYPGGQGADPRLASGALWRVHDLHATPRGGAASRCRRGLDGGHAVFLGGGQGRQWCVRHRSHVWLLVGCRPTADHRVRGWRRSIDDRRRRNLRRPVLELPSGEGCSRRSSLDLIMQRPRTPRSNKLWLPTRCLGQTRGVRRDATTGPSCRPKDVAPWPASECGTGRTSSGSMLASGSERPMSTPYFPSR